MSDEQLKQAMDTIAAQSETIAETTQAFTDMTRMTLDLATAVRAATPREELLSFMITVMQDARELATEEGNERSVLLCEYALDWLDMFKKDDK